MSDRIANTPKPPYYAVIFSSLRTTEQEDYTKTAARMIELAATQEGFLGVESAREELGITVSYWKDLESIKAWKFQTEHQLARARGRAEWYRQFKTRIAKVERDYGFELE